MAQRDPGSGAALRTRLRGLVEPLVEADGLYLEDLTVSRAGRRHLVRVTVDGDKGVGHDELSAVSHRLSAALDQVEATDGDLGVESYTLEVSSPGVDRPLTLPRHWRRNVGRMVTVRVGERTLTARVAGVTEDGVDFEAPGPAAVPFAELGAGRVQVEFNRLTELNDDDFGVAFTDDGEGFEDDGDGPSELEDMA